MRWFITMMQVSFAIEKILEKRLFFGNNSMDFCYEIEAPQKILRCRPFWNIHQKRLPSSSSLRFDNLIAEDSALGYHYKLRTTQLTFIFRYFAAWLMSPRWLLVGQIWKRFYFIFGVCLWLPAVCTARNITMVFWVLIGEWFMAGNRFVSRDCYRFVPDKLYFFEILNF